ncbi:MAG: alpha/beta hydrolase-fold protein [Gemmatales bacterium]|nr:alpha/beta hydrolase-fold protein [Gemmatales bacterium]MDW7994864.1 alpha/beta hydrolase-fold protein [Gemmatales bacterium]
MENVWQRYEVAGHAVDWYLPAGLSRPLWGVIYLHGRDQVLLRDEPYFTYWLERLQLACAAPLGGEGWWVDKIAPSFDTQRSAEDYVVHEVVPWLERQWQLRVGRIGLFGVSLGGHGALRLAFKYPKLFPVVSAISPTIDFYEAWGQGSELDVMYSSREHCRLDSALLHIQLESWPEAIYFCCDPADFWYPGNERLREKLTVMGIEHTCDLMTSAGGHSWDYFYRMAEPALRFVRERLERYSRRLL